MEQSSVANFQEYIRIKSVQPNPDYASCVKFLQKQAEEIPGATFKVDEFHPGKPVVVISVKGKDDTLPSVLLNSHMDVVPVFPDHWKYDPFSGHKDDDGNIYGRGTQDMKCVGIQYLEAMKSLVGAGTTLRRTVHMSFVPDEEIGGINGMMPFVTSEAFKKMNIGFALDEGYASESDDYFLFYGERNQWVARVTCPGSPGHASQFIENHAAKKLRKVINSFLNFRDEEEKKLLNNPDLHLGDVISVNLTQLKGGVQSNVLPDKFVAGFNIRVPPGVDFYALQTTFKQWCKDAGDDVTIDFEYQDKIKATSCTEDGKSKWWDAFSAACKTEKIMLKKRIFPAGTDCRYVRDIAGMEAFGFSPMNRTPLLLHDHNEFLNEKVFLRGIQIYKTIISHVANVA